MTLTGRIICVMNDMLFCTYYVDESLDGMSMMVFIMHMKHCDFYAIYMMLWIIYD
jgi:hypothetical protein